jgi:hypothetical protein
VRARHRARRQQSGNFIELAGRTFRDAADEARRIFR